jgi:D-serine deaminase-like pyridoxal phosphate-dependent protein
VRVADLPTPVLVVDLDRLERNIAAWQAAISSHGRVFRPHVKTHKALEIARMQLDAGAAGITVAKVAEAEVFVDGGVGDVVVAYPVVGEDACRRLAELAGRARMGVNVESVLGAERLSAAAAAAGSEIDVYVDVDTGLGRCGVAPEPGAVAAMADMVRRLPGLRLRGITGYRGYLGDDPESAGREEAELLVSLSREAGVEEVATGSTPTGRAAAAVDGVTEVRAGTYVFNDLMQRRFGSATRDDIALTIVTTVVSVGPEGRVTVDGGSKTFSGDASVPRDDGPIVAESDDGAVAISRLTEEHGVGRTARPLAVGDRVAFHPAHVCTTVNLSDRLVVTRDGVVEATWEVAARGRRT